MGLENSYANDVRQTPDSITVPLLGGVCKKQIHEDRTELGLPDERGYGSSKRGCRALQMQLHFKMPKVAGHNGAFL